MIVVEGACGCDGNEQILRLFLFAVAIVVGAVALALALAVLQLYNWLM